MSETGRGKDTQRGRERGTKREIKAMKERDITELRDCWNEKIGNVVTV